MSSKLTRRQFLKSAGLASASLAAASALPGRFLAPAFAQSAPTITLGLNSVQDSLDAHTAIGPNVSGTRIYGLFHDSLLQTSMSGELKPMLATEWVNDGLEWRFKLREGVIFHDGSTMTADDVVYTFERLLDPANETSNFGQDLQRFVSSVQETGELEVTFTSTATDPLLPIRINSYWASIVPRAGTEAMDEATRQTKPIGAGPYKIVEYVPGDRLVVERHEEYWGGTPPAGQVVVRFIPEDATRIAALQSGDVDLISQVPVDQLDVIGSASGLVYASTATANHMAVNLNTVKGPTADINVRRALTLGIDRQLIVDALWNGLTTVSPDYMFPGAFGYDPDYPGFPYDPEAARAALAASSYDGTPINFQATRGYYANMDVIMPAMKQMWEDIGLTINYEPMDSSAYLDLYFAGDVIMGMQQFNGAGDGQQFFETWATENIWRPNYYQPSAEFDEIYTQISQSTDSDVRYSGLQRLKQIFDEDVVIAPIYRNIDIYAFSDNITWQPGPEFLVDFRPGNLSF